MNAPFHLLPALREIEVLFRPFLHRKMQLSSRIVMAPVERLLAPGGVPTSEMLRYYVRRAQHGVGLILSEPVYVDEPAASPDSAAPLMAGGAALRAWKAICRAVHASHCRMAPMLSHAGMLRPLQGDIPHPEMAPIGPSGLHPISLEQLTMPMDRTRMNMVCQSFAESAAKARLLGFDAIAINAGRGALLDQFLRACTNLRSDEYGGDVLRRTRFVCDVLYAVRKAVGRNFPIVLRISLQGPAGAADTPLARHAEELSQLLAPFVEAGVDIFDCDSRHHAEPAFPGSGLTFAGWVRLLSGRPVIAEGQAGLFAETPHAEMERILRTFRARGTDLLAVGRALLADAEWCKKIHHGQEERIIPFTPRSMGHLF